MASEYKGLYVEFEGNSSKLTAALADINAASRKSQSALKGVQNALKFDPGSTKLLATAMDAARGKVEATKRRVDTLKQAQDNLAKSGDTTSDAYKRVSRELAQAEAYLKRDQRALIDATAAASGFGKASRYLRDFSDAAGRLSDGLTTAGSKLTTGVTLPLAAIAGASVSAAVTIDSALTDVRKTTDLTEAQYQSLKDSAVELSKTQPVDAATILSLEGLGAQLGWSDDKLQSFAQTVSGLDIATDMNAEQAATNLAQFANITGMAQDQAENYASAIVGLGNNMATTESKISDMAMGMASAGTQAGMSQADILGVAAATASLGMEAQAGGTAFSKTINEISTQVSTNGGQLQQWAALAHMSVDDFKSAWQTDVTGTFEAVIKGMGDAAASGEDLNVILADLGITETRQSDFMRRLAGNSDLLTQAVDLSNQSWSENSALQGEVDNRNQSLASKFEVLRNRVVAVAEELGGPLADAALDAVDAAEPIADTIEGAAKAFSSMSKEEQQGIIKTVALAAAAGPLLSIAGKAIGVFGSVAGGLSTIVEGVGTLKAATEVTGSFGGALDILGIKGAAAAGGITLAVAAVAALGFAAYDAWKTEEDFNGAIDAMRDSSDGAASALEDGARSVTAWDDASQDAAMNTKELTSAIREHNDTMAGIRDGAYESVEMLGQYQSVIDQLAGKGEASAEDTAMLEWALDGLNEALGTSYTSADVLTGEYEDQEGAVHDLKEEIDGLIQKKQDEARVNATQDLYTESLKNQLEMKRNLTAAEDEYAKKQEEVGDAWKTAYQHGMESLGMNKEAAANYADSTTGLDAYKQKLDEATSSYDAATEETSEWAEQMGIAQIACTDAGRAMSDFLANTKGWADALSDVGFSVDELAGACTSAGISTDTLSAMGSDAFAKLAASAGGDVGKLTSMLSTLSQMKIDPKTFTVTDNGTIEDESGNVWDLDKMTINDKPFEVNDDGTISIEQYGVDHLSASKVASKNYRVSSNGTVKNETRNTNNLNGALDNVPGTYTAKVKVSGAADAKAAVGGVLSNLYRLTSRTFTAFVKTVKIGSGHAAGGIRLHADGGAIYTGPTFITPNDVIGEDGAEYYDGTHIVPLTNRRYSQPFADVIADGIMSRLDTSYSRPNVTINRPTTVIRRDGDFNSAMVTLDRSIANMLANY